MPHIFNCVTAAVTSSCTVTALSAIVNGVSSRLLRFLLRTFLSVLFLPLWLFLCLQRFPAFQMVPASLNSTQRRTQKPRRFHNCLHKKTGYTLRIVGFLYCCYVVIKIAMLIFSCCRFKCHKDQIFQFVFYGGFLAGQIQNICLMVKFHQ